MPRFQCCGISFDGEQPYVEHRQKIHGEAPQVKYTCCGIKFYTDEGYSEHRENIHSGAKPGVGRRGWLARLFRRS
ncbi:MAG: hypothetical protein HY671_14930 [Chloroflexi bacterium]|nr:hypothetical protein [Chloroflexota bacterium]